MKSVAIRLANHFRTAAPAGVHSVYLFGSHAEGRAHQESDVDVAVLLDWKRYATAKERFGVRVDLGSELIAALDNNRVDVVILNDAPPELGRAIVTRGVRVFCGDPEADHAYVRDIQLQAADLVPWLERMRRIKLAALDR